MGLIILSPLEQMGVMFFIFLPMAIFFCVTVWVIFRHLIKRPTVVFYTKIITFSLLISLLANFIVFYIFSSINSFHDSTAIAHIIYPIIVLGAGIIFFLRSMAKLTRPASHNE